MKIAAMPVKVPLTHLKIMIFVAENEIILQMPFQGICNASKNFALFTVFKMKLYPPNSSFSTKCRVFLRPLEFQPGGILLFVSAELCGRE
jgi:hypothetical protein